MTDFVVKRDADSDETDDLMRTIKRSKKDSEGSDSQNILFEFKSSKVLSDSAREKNIFIHGKVKLFLKYSILIGIKQLKLQWQLYAKGKTPVMSNRIVNCTDSHL